MMAYPIIGGLRVYYVAANADEGCGHKHQTAVAAEGCLRRIPRSKVWMIAFPHQSKRARFPVKLPKGVRI